MMKYQAIKLSLLLCVIGTLNACIEANMAMQINTENTLDNNGENVIQGEQTAVLKNAMMYYYNDSSELSQIFQYDYDEQGKLMSIFKDYDADGVVDSVESYEYDDEGKLVLLESSSNNGQTGTYLIYSYNELGNLSLLEYDFSRDSNIDEYVIFFYNDADQFIREEEYHDGVLSFTKDYEYDNDGRMVFILVKDGLGDSLYEKRFFYDGDLIVREEGPESIKYFTYDANGNLLEQVEVNTNFGSQSTRQYQNTYW